MRELTDFEKEAARLALVKMFRTDGWFDITTVDALLRVTGAVPDRREYEALRALHCVHFRDMTAPMRQAVVERTLALLAAQGFDIPSLDASFLPTPEPSVQPARPSLWSRVKGALPA